MIALRGAEALTGQDADTAFTAIEEQVRDLRDLGRAHPLSTDMAVARVKRYLEAGEAARIRLHDLVSQETARACQQADENMVPAGGLAVTPQELALRLQRYEAATETLLALTVAGAYWGTTDQVRVWVDCLPRLIPVPYDPGIGVWQAIRGYPALVVFYGGGLAAVAAGRYDTLTKLMLDARVRDGGKVRPLARILSPTTVVQEQVSKLIPSVGNASFPICTYLARVLRAPLRALLPDDERFEEVFNEFEYLRALVYLDLRLEGKERAWADVGNFAVNWRFRNEQLPELNAALADAGDQWPPLRAGLFGGSLVRLQRAKGLLDEAIQG